MRGWHGRLCARRCEESDGDVGGDCFLLTVALGGDGGSAYEGKAGG